MGSLEKRDQCNSGIIVLKHCVAIIDYPKQEPEEEIIEEAERITGLPVRYIILTHPHSDHVDGFKSLNRTDISVIARDSAIEYLFRKGYFIPPVYAGISHSTDFVLDGVSFRFEVPTFTAHSPWDMMIGLEEESILFTGDLLALPKNMFFHTSDLEGWITEVDVLSESKWKYIARGHGSVIEKAEIKETLKYLQKLNEARLWQMKHNEDVSIDTIHNKRLSSELQLIVDDLLTIADEVNVTRQINQVYYRLRCEQRNNLVLK